MPASGTLADRQKRQTHMPTRQREVMHYYKQSLRRSHDPSEVMTDNWRWSLSTMWRTRRTPEIERERGKNRERWR